MPFRFTALEDFYSEETASHYVAGLSYTARPQDAQLNELIPQWIEQGKVALGGFDAILEGKG